MVLLGERQGKPSKDVRLLAFEHFWIFSCEWFEELGIRALKFSDQELVGPR